MKFKFIIFVFACFFCQGCASTLLSKLPNKSFEKMTYERNILGSIGQIKASNAQVINGTLVIGDLYIKEITPWGQAELTIVGYKKEAKTE